jgi:hypothetical protein
MRPSPWSIGFVMIVAGAGTVLYAWSNHVPPTALSLIAAAVLCLGGGALFVRRRAAWLVALGAAIITAGFAAASFLLRREVGLPLPPIVTLVLGLYMTMRVLLLRSSFDPPAPTPSVDTDAP